MAENLEKILEDYLNEKSGVERVLGYLGNALSKNGIGELEKLQREEMLGNFNRLHAATQVFLLRFTSFEALVAERESFDRAYELLKLMAASAINLLDLEEPSLKPLASQKPFEIEQEGHRFTVF